MSPSFSHVLVVRYAECDAQGVVFNAHYQALCDAVFDLWVLARLGREWQRSIGADFSMVVSSAFQYRSPARFLDAIRIEGEVTRWGRTSFEVTWTGEIDDDPSGPRRVFDGVMRYVCVDAAKRPTPIDATFRRAIENEDENDADEMHRGAKKGGGGSPRGTEARRASAPVSEG